MTDALRDTQRGERPPFERSLDVLRTNAVIKWGARAGVVLGPLMFVLAMANVFPPGFLGLHLFVASLSLMIFSSRSNMRPVPTRANIRTDAEGIHVDGVLTVPKSAIADGFFQPRVVAVRKDRPVRPTVRFVDRWRRVLFEAETDENDALSMLHALGLDPGSKRAVFNGSSPVYTSIPRNMAFVFGGIALFGAVGFALSALGLRSAESITPLLIAPWVLVGFLPTKIAVGIDGIHLGWLWRKKFIPMADITSVVPMDDRVIHVARRDGSSEKIFTSMRRRSSFSGSDPYAIQQRDAVLARIREAKAAFTSGGPTADISSLIARGTRTQAEWLAELAKIRQGLAGGAGYRDVTLREDDLLRLVEDPKATEDARAGAALLLSGALDDEKRARIRVAAEASASPKLRVALDASTEDDEEALHEAMGELENENEKCVSDHESR